MNFNSAPNYLNEEEKKIWKKMKIPKPDCGQRERFFFNLRRMKHMELNEYTGTVEILWRKDREV